MSRKVKITLEVTLRKPRDAEFDDRGIDREDAAGFDLECFDRDDLVMALNEMFEDEYKLEELTPLYPCVASKVKAT